MGEELTSTRHPLPSPTLVVLAAGTGSRYGGLKQLQVVGPAGGGEALMDYSIYDALRAGFRSVVFVVRPEIEAAVREFVEPRYGARIPVTIALQRLSDVPGGARVPLERPKPWGTAHAVLAAEPCVSGPFAVLNADDFYGRPALAAVAAFFAHNGPTSPPTYALAGYRLRDTLSAAGGVNRAICRVDADGWLEGLDEVRAIHRDGDGRLVGTGSSGTPHLSDDVLVSMNLWAFTPAIFDTLRLGFREFLADENARDREYLLPTAIERALRRSEFRVRVLAPESPWFGLTHPADRPIVEAALQRAVSAGEYPERLWR